MFSRGRLRVAVIAAALAVTGGVFAAPAAPAKAAGPYTLRVYNNNIENLVTNLSGGGCRRISGTDHINSVVFDGVAPDIFTVQQVRGQGQIDAYADQMSARFGYPAGTYKTIYVYDNPEEWGSTHSCNDQSLGDLKKRQTNGIIYNSSTLTLNDTSAFWSAGWLKPGTSYSGGAGCKLYKSPASSTQSYDDGTTNQYKWKRTSAIAAQFSYKATGTTIGVATQHLPEGNGANPCGGAGSTGINGTDISYGGTASTLLKNSTIRVIGIDANKSGIDPNALNGEFGVTSRGSAGTLAGDGDAPAGAKIDYLFTNGSVQASDRDYTVSGTKSNHKAVYAFITL